jgi:hypothetical protein
MGNRLFSSLVLDVLHGPPTQYSQCSSSCWTGQRGIHPLLVARIACWIAREGDGFAEAFGNINEAIICERGAEAAGARWMGRTLASPARTCDAGARAGKAGAGPLERSPIGYVSFTSAERAGSNMPESACRLLTFCHSHLSRCADAVAASSVHAPAGSTPSFTVTRTSRPRRATSNGRLSPG